MDIVAEFQKVMRCGAYGDVWTSDGRLVVRRENNVPTTYAQKQKMKLIGWTYENVEDLEGNVRRGWVSPKMPMPVHGTLFGEDWLD